MTLSPTSPDSPSTSAEISSTVMGPGFWDHAEVDRREIIPRRRASTSEVLDEWMAVSPRFEGVVASVEVPLAGGIVGDFICHEHDIRAAMGRPGERSSAEAQLGLDIYARSMARRVTGGQASSVGHSGWGPRMDRGRWRPWCYGQRRTVRNVPSLDGSTNQRTGWGLRVDR